MAGPDERRQLEAMRGRLERLGLQWREAPGGRALLVKLPLGPDPLSTGGPPLQAPHVIFATVGANRIKCLKPRPLFHLPLVSIAECSTPEAIEGRIREAWRARHVELREARSWLEKLGCAPALAEPDPVLRLAVGLENPEAQARVIERGSLILPGCGPLSGATLRRAEDRRFRPDPGVESAVDLELALATRLEELLRLDERLVRQARRRADRAEPQRVLARRARRHRVLLVGPNLLEATSLADSLRVRGYAVEAARTASDALHAFERASFELVITDSDLGRYEGVELIASLRALPGIEEIPVLLIDERLRPERRETARRLGAAGYLTHPLDVGRIEAGLARLVEEPSRRRFTRYTQQLGVRSGGAKAPELTAQIGRGGMLLLTERDLPVQTVEPYAIALPHGGGSVCLEAEVSYRVRGVALQRQAVGLRFHAFAGPDEERLIGFLRSLEERG